MLVVADEVFTMMDKTLNQPARYMVPNTLMESSMVTANPANHDNPNWRSAPGLHTKGSDRDGMNRNDNCAKNDELLNVTVQRSELIRQNEQWHNTQHAVQAHLFDDASEPRDISVFDFLMS